MHMRAETFVRHLEDSGATVERLADGDLLVTGSGRRVAVRIVNQPITATAVVDAYVRGLSAGLAPGLAGLVQGDARRWADRFGVALYDLPAEPIEAFDLAPLAVAARAAAALDQAVAASVAVHPSEEFVVEAVAPTPLLAPVESVPLLAPVGVEAAVAPPEIALVHETVFDPIPSVAPAPVDAVSALGDFVHAVLWEEMADEIIGPRFYEEAVDDDADTPGPTLAEVLFEMGAAPHLEAFPEFPDRTLDAADTLALVEALEAGEAPVTFSSAAAEPVPVEAVPEVPPVPAFAPDPAALPTLLGEAVLPARPAPVAPAYEALAALIGEARLPPRRIRAVAAAPDVAFVLFGEAKRPQPGPRFESVPAALVDLLGFATPPARARAPAAPEALVALYGTAKPKLATPRARFPEPAAETLLTLLGPARRPHPVRRVRFPAPTAERLGDLFGEASPPTHKWTLPWAPRPALPWDAPRAPVLVAAGTGATETAPAAERFWATISRGAKPTDWLSTFVARPQV